MQNKGTGLMRLQLLYLSLKNIKLFYFIPLAVMYIFIPVSNCLNIKAFGVEVSYSLIMDTAQMLIPITSTWWIFCILKEYVDGDGNELLYVYENIKKTKAYDVLLVFAWYCLHIAVLFFIYSLFYNNIFLEYIRIIIQSFVFISAFYCFAYLFKSTSISYMFVLAYYMMALFFSKDTMFESVNIFSTNQMMSINILTTEYIYVVLAGLVLFTLGILKNKQYFK
jgi:hypothetical protein